ncbi:MAG TPA: hypothetical protein VFS18_03355 [Actinomycetota bacterium]|nr:hypothetical protein [Actinomycetota bacterium]
MLEGLVFVVGIVAFVYVAVRYGKSTRDGEDWSIHPGPTGW